MPIILLLPISKFSYLLLQSIGRALFCGVMTTYVLFAVEFYEEPLLVEIFGQEYVDYMKITPRYIPNIMSLISKKTD